VIAQVDAPSQRTQQGIADGQGGSHLNAGRLHGFPMWGFDHDVRAQSIGHHPADDTACSRPFQRLDHFESVVIRQPDVKSQMDMILRSINICDHGLDGRVGIRQQGRAVATHGLEAIDRVSEPEEVGVSLWDFRLQIRRINSRGLGKVRHGGQHCVQATHAPAADTGFTEKDISQDADHGQNNHDNDPGNP
jgi:hypothetical protein